MDQERKTTSRWPQTLGPKDNLYVVQNDDTDEPEYLIFSSMKKRATFMRNNGAWWRIDQNVIMDFDDLKYSIYFVEPDYIDEYDRFESTKFSDKVQMNIPSDAAVVTAAAYECPPATQDIKLNLKNRSRAISVANYGPLNPKEENKDFWEEKAENWSVSIDDAKKSLCANCVFFVVTDDVKNCIASGLEQGGSSSNDAWDSIVAAELGYCEAFDFKCAGSRTCDAWAVGGPIDNNSQGARKDAIS